ncbi:cytochrome p450, partial [Fusarium albosuccineum]
HAAASLGVIDCTEVFTKATLDIIGATVLGLELENLSSVSFASKEDSHAGKAKPASKREYSFYEAYEIILEQGLLGKILLFASGFFPVRWIPIAENREYMFCTDWVRRVLQRTIIDRRAQVKSKMASEKVEHCQLDSRDLLTFIVEESMPGHPAEGLKEDNFLGHLMQFMVADHATSADTITWCVYILATRPDIQDKLRAEIDDMLARVPHPTHDDITSCTYMENFIREALRIYAPSTSHHRAAAKEVIIDGVRISKGTTVDIVPSVTMLNPTIWGVDADTPDPTRWDRLTGDQLSPYAFQAFANGSRMCIGKSYAMLEIKCILIDMVPRFRFHAVGKPFTIENPGFAMRPSGLEVRVEKIV